MTQTLTIAQARIGLFDPQDCTDSADALALLDAVFDPLVRRTSGSNTASSSASASALSVQSCGSNRPIRVWAIVNVWVTAVPVAGGGVCP